MSEPATEPILSVKDLVVEYRTGKTRVRAVREVSFDVYPEESLALVGESGCGKTTLGLALLRLLPRLGEVPAGEVRYRRRDGSVVDLLALEKEELRRFRWHEAAMVFQGAMNSFNPVLRIGEQLRDTARAHTDWSRRTIDERGAELLRMVRLEPDRVLAAYPHELSGGMRQRVLIALSLLLDPRVLVFDEPTTALDILTQRRIVDMLKELRRELKFAMVFISHDLALAAELADRMATMYAGRIVEIGTVDEMFYRPKHPYTAGLIRAVPPVTGDPVGEDAAIASIPGGPPSLSALPSGCPFHPRCSLRAAGCEETDPPLEHVGPDHATACHYAESVHLDRKVVSRG